MENSDNIEILTYNVESFIVEINYGFRIEDEYNFKSKLIKIKLDNLAVHNKLKDEAQKYKAKFKHLSS